MDRENIRQEEMKFNTLDRLRRDFNKLENLFGRFEAADDQTKVELAHELLKEIRLLMAIEEKVIYPALESETGTEILWAEMKTRQSAVQELTDELQKAYPTEDVYKNKLSQLIQLVKSHIEYEDRHLLPPMEKAALDFSRLDRDIEDIKKKILEEYGADAVGVSAGSDAERSKNVRAKTRRSMMFLSL